MGLTCSSDSASLKCPSGDCNLSLCKSSCWSKEEEREQPEPKSPSVAVVPSSPSVVSPREIQLSVIDESIPSPPASVRQ